MTSPEKPQIRSEDITRSTRDRDRLRDRLETWLGSRLPGATITDLVAPSNGMSSDTVLFDATWDDPVGAGGAQTAGRFVARIEPSADAVPIFPTYDLATQRRAIDHVARHTGAPVPRVRWLETDSGVLGGSFFVMDRVDGRVPPDVLPYTMDGFVLDLTPDQLAEMQDATVDAIAEIHRAPLADDTEFLDYPEPGDTALRRHVEHWRAIHRWVAGRRTIPVLDATSTWLDAHWPRDAAERAPVLSWGDSRIGNIIYDDQNRPAAVLDWEMVGIAPREVDLGWLAFLHTFFQDITVELGLPGLPGMLHTDDIARRYADQTGVEPVDLAWFEVYAAYRHGIVMARVRDRQVHFGEAEPPTDPDDAVMHAARLRQLIGATGGTAARGGDSG